jgi:hypothetical protein
MSTAAILLVKSVLQLEEAVPRLFAMVLFLER